MVPISDTKAPGNYNVSLTAREVKLLASLELERVSSLTIDEARRRLGAHAKKVVSSLSRKGALQRVGRGVYLVRPFRALTRPGVSSSAVAAALLLRHRPYYLGGLWACTFHHLTSQSYGSRVDAFVTTRLRSRAFGSSRLVFHVVPAARLRGGIVTATVEDAEVHVSTRERTLIDALDFPRAAGGVENAVAMVSANLARVDQRALIEDAARISGPSTVQRLGVLLERLKVAPRALAPLRRQVRRSRPLTAMLPGRPRRGPINARWRVIENDR